MKYLITADLHLKEYNDTEHTETGIPKKLIEIINVCRSMFDYAINNNIKNIIIAGDIGDLKHIVHPRSFILLMNLIREYSDLNFIILKGNHDIINKNDIMSSIELFSGLENVTIIKETTKIDNITFIPWSVNISEEIKKSEGNDILISHLGLNEATLSSGISLKTKIKAKDLRKFKSIFLGHYHKPQQIENIFYVGSPIQKDRGEAGEEKRFIVVDSESLDVESIPTDGYRKYREIILEDDSEINSIKSDLIQYKKNGDFVFIRKKSKEAPKELKEELEGMSIIDEYEEEVEIRGIKSSMTDTEQFRKYLEIKNINEENRDMYMDVIESVLFK